MAYCHVKYRCPTSCSSGKDQGRAGDRCSSAKRQARARALGEKEKRGKVREVEEKEGRKEGRVCTVAKFMASLPFAVASAKCAHIYTQSRILAGPLT